MTRYIGLATDFFVRTAEEWRHRRRNPFSKEADRDPSHLVVMVFKDRPSGQAVQELQQLTSAVIQRKVRTRGTGRKLAYGPEAQRARRGLRLDTT